MTFVETTPVVIPPIEQLEEMKPIKVRKKRAPKHDFKDGCGRIFAHRHDNGRGWVADSANVDDSVYVGPRCEVFNRAIIKGSARLEGASRVSGTAVVSGRVIMRKSAHVYGAAVVRDSTEVSDNARIGGSSHVSGTSRVFGEAVISDSAQLFSTTVAGASRIGGAALIVRSHVDGYGGFVEIKGDCSVINANVRGRVIIERQAQIIRSTLQHMGSELSIHVTDFAIVADTSHIYCPMIIKEHAAIMRSTLTWFGSSHETMTTNNLPQLAGRVVIQHQNFRSAAELQNYLNLLMQHGGRQGAAQIMPNGQIATFPTRRITFDQPASPRRVMRLQEAAT